jgi:hypothetical protein
LEKKKGDIQMARERTTFELLRDLRDSNIIIDIVHIRETNSPEDAPILEGVRILEVGIDFVSFGQVASPGAGVTVVLRENIVSFEY